MAKKNNCKYVFVVGGVISGVGKGITSSSLGLILKNRGLKVTAIKIDPYINIDAGTMNPTEHGEVFVLEDGDETDNILDMLLAKKRAPDRKAWLESKGNIAEV